MAEAYIECTKFFLRKKLYFNTVFCFKYVRRLLAICRLRLDLRDSDVKKRYSQIKKEYNNLLVIVLNKTKSPKTILMSILFFVSPRIYQRFWMCEKRDGV